MRTDHTPLLIPTEPLEVTAITRKPEYFALGMSALFFLYSVGSMLSVGLGWAGPFVKTLGSSGCSRDADFLDLCSRLLCSQVTNTQAANDFSEISDYPVSTFMALCAQSCSFYDAISPYRFAATDNPEIFTNCALSGSQIALFSTGILAALLALCCGAKYCCEVINRRNAQASAEIGTVINPASAIMGTAIGLPDGTVYGTGTAAYTAPVPDEENNTPRP